MLPIMHAESSNSLWKPKAIIYIANYTGILERITAYTSFRNFITGSHHKYTSIHNDCDKLFSHAFLILMMSALNPGHFSEDKYCIMTYLSIYQTSQSILYPGS